MGQVQDTGAGRVVRLWTLHPEYLDAKGLVALWREALLAQRVLQGATKGYRSHPQLLRFRATSNPLHAIGAFLGGIADEAAVRGYRFDRSRITAPDYEGSIEETDGQLLFEMHHLKGKLAARSPQTLERLPASGLPQAHPLFRIVHGPVRTWEKGASNH
jgi:hypothetical protein